MKKRLTIEQRKRIELLYNKGERIAYIASAIGVMRNTVYSEIKRGLVNGYYSAEVGQQKYEENISGNNRGSIISKNKDLQEFIKDRILNQGKSPEQIANELKELRSEKLGAVSYNTIYRAITLGEIPGLDENVFRNCYATIQKDGSLYLPKWLFEEKCLQYGQRFTIVLQGESIVLNACKE